MKTGELVISGIIGAATGSVIPTLILTAGVIIVESAKGKQSRLLAIDEKEAALAASKKNTGFVRIEYERTDVASGVGCAYTFYDEWSPYLWMYDYGE